MSNYPATPSFVLRHRQPAETRLLAEKSIQKLTRSIPPPLLFEGYVKEGVDQKVLRGLFNNLGLETPNYPSGNSEQPKGENEVFLESTSKDSVDQSTPRKDMIPKSSISVSKINLIQGSLNSSAMKPSPDLVAPKLSNFSHAIPSLKQKAAKGQMERKDLIAKLVAKQKGESSQAQRELSPKLVINHQISAITKESGNDDGISSTPLQVSKIAPFTSGNLKSSLQPNEIRHSTPVIQQKTVLPDSKTVPFQAPATSQALPLPISSVPSSFSGIPGLFLAPLPHSPPHNPAAVEAFVISSQPPTANRRKRPVASDFDPEPAQPPRSFKRPFSRSRTEKPLIIDVSEDETADGDDDQSHMDGIVLSNKVVSEDESDNTNQQRAIDRDLPPLSENPSRNSSIPSAPLAKKDSAQIKTQVKTMEQRIEDLHRQIAEKEQQKKLRLVLSRSQTPGTPGSIEKHIHPNRSNISSATLANLPSTSDIDHTIELATKKISEEKIKIAQLTAGQPEVLGKSQANTHVEVQTQPLDSEPAVLPLPDSSAIVSEKRSTPLAISDRCSSISKEVDFNEKEKELSRKAELQKELRAELARHEEAILQGLKAKERIIDKLKGLGIIEDIFLPLVSVETIKTLKAANREDEATKSSSPQPLNGSEISPVLQANSRKNLLQIRSLSPVNTPSRIAPSNLNSENGPIASNIKSLSPNGEGTHTFNEGGRPITDDEASNPLSDHSSMQMQVKDRSPESQDIDMEDAYAPDANQLAPADQILDLYGNDFPKLGPGGVQKELRQLFPSNPVPYSGGHKSPGSHPKELGIDTMMTSHSNPILKIAKAAASNDAPAEALTSNTNAADPQPIAIIPVLAETRTQPDPFVGSSRDFEPYESPLHYFRAFRYHPRYQEFVKGGFNSLTYSHNINPVTPICHFESTGGICNDPSCLHQHFRDMEISEDNVLVQMGSINEGQGDLDRATYTSGLAEIIQSMRAQKIKDFATVAAQIVAYRSSFLKDPSRILVLDLADNNPSTSAPVG
ncbi:MAG: hypothetical protein M1829_005856 [Trizodia sp. TS-e1964]|nr:MAG: hypothetical protein M1829_005856 [Trizodia sp. TS-e1964]